MTWRERKSRRSADASPDTELLQRRVLENAHDAYVAIDDQGRIIDWNPAAERCFGYRADAVMGREMADLLIPERYRAAHRAGLERYRSTGEGRVLNQRLELTARRADGSEFPVEMTISVDEQADRPTFHAFIADITARKAAERDRQLLAAVVRSSEDAIVTVDSATAVTSWNEGAERLYAYTAAEAIGRPLAELIALEPSESQADVLAVALSGERVKPYETELRQKHGTLIEVSLSLAPITDSTGAVTGASAIAREITETKRLHRELQAIFDNVPAGLVLRDLDGRYRHVNAYVSRTRGLSADEVVGRRPEDLYPPEVTDAIRAQDEELLRMREARTYEITVPHVDGSKHDYHVVQYPIVDAHGEVSGVGTFSLDVTERNQADARWHEAKERFRHAFENAPIGIALVAPDGRWLRVNPALCEIVGYSADELAGLTFQDITHPEDLDADLDQVRRVLAGDIDRYSMEKRYFHKDGHEVWIELSVSLVRDGEGAPMYFVSQIQDISNRKRYEGELQHLADHDVLTGMFNRRRFDVELHRAVSRARRYHEPAALLVIDIDNFKFINDAYGHAAGDDLIARAASAIRDRLRETDIAARLGGDEFAVILSHAEPEQARLVANSLVSELPALSDTPRHGPQMTASVGIAMITPDTQLSAEDLLIEADLAMYDAKDAGRDRITVATFDSDAPHSVKGRIAWVQRIHDALDSDGLVLYQQPLLDLRSEEITRYELLLRMKGENGDVIPPSAFLSTAERSGLIGAIDRWVISEATRILNQRHDAGERLTLEVNISGVSVCDPRILEHVVAELSGARFDPSQLVLEITETAAILNIAQARRFAEHVRRLGCQLALDDFGSGFSSFQYLKHLPFDTVKIDGSFVKNLASSHVDQVAVGAIVQMAHGLGKTVVAEHVEDSGTLNYLRERVIDYAQGYHIGKPALADELWGGVSLARPRD